MWKIYSHKFEHSTCLWTFFPLRVRNLTIVNILDDCEHFFRYMYKKLTIFEHFRWLWAFFSVRVQNIDNCEHFFVTCTKLTVCEHFRWLWTFFSLLVQNIDNCEHFKMIVNIFLLLVQNIDNCENFRWLWTFFRYLCKTLTTVNILDDCEHFLSLLQNTDKLWTF